MGQPYDEREAQFDIRRLDDGDVVEVFVDEERVWMRGRFEISSSGELRIHTRRGDPIALHEALRHGVRRVIH